MKAKYSDNVDAPVWDLGGFYFHDAAVQTNGVESGEAAHRFAIRLANNIRYFPSRIDGLQSVPEPVGYVIVKQVPLQGRVRLQFNVEILNALNRVVYNDANTDPTTRTSGK